MRKFLKVISLLMIFSCLFLAGCTSELDNKEADVSDETFLSPEEEKGSIAGIWSSEDHELKINRYFYGSGQLVSIIEDSEQDFWCILSYWKEENEENYSVTNDKAYKYNDETSEWEEISPSVTSISSFIKNSDDALTIEETLPNGTEGSFSYTRSSLEIQLPDEAEINLIINDFLIH